MSKKIIILTIFMMVTCSTAFGHSWDNGGSGNLWSTDENWSDDTEPTSSDDVWISTGGTGPTIDATVTAACAIARVGGSSTTETITMTGGTYTGASHLILGESSGSTVTLNISGGTLNAYTLWAGNSGAGIVNMTGGTMNLSSESLYISRFSENGTFNLDGGTVNANGIYMSAGALDLDGGTLIIDGDVNSTIASYVSSGYITANNGGGTVLHDYNITNAGKTTVTASGGGSAPGKATTPTPANAATAVDVNDALFWAAVVDANNYNVYFGTSSPGSLIGNQDPNTYDPAGAMDANTVYYWRIDANNVYGATTGDVWSFTTAVASGPPSKATTPAPANAATAVDVNDALFWAAVGDANNYNVYFGTSSPGSLIGNQDPNTYDPAGAMDANTTYYWRIDANNVYGATTGDVWSFTTATTGGGEILSDGDFEANAVAASVWNDFKAKTSMVNTWIYPGWSDRLDWASTGGNPGRYIKNYALTCSSATAFYQSATAPGSSNDYTFSFDYLNTDGSGNANVFSWAVWGYASGDANDTLEYGNEWDFVGSQTSDGTLLADGNFAPGTVSWTNFESTSFTISSGFDRIVVGLAIDEHAVGQGDAVGFDNVSLTLTGGGGSPPSKATTPSPANAATAVDVNDDLSWAAVGDANNYNVYFGTSSPGSLIGNQDPNTYDPGTMNEDTVYYWRIDANNVYGATTGDVWSFTTAADSGPSALGWDNGGSGTLWSTSGNWNPDDIPGSSTDISIYVDGTGPTIDATVTAVSNIIRAGGTNMDDNMTMTGGTLTTSSHLILGESSGSTATLTMSGGTINAYSLWAGNNGHGYVNMTGGTINITSQSLYIATYGSGDGNVQLDGGTITAPAIDLSTGGLLDLEGGTLILDGNDTSTVASYISSGYITAYDTNGTVNYDYNVTNAGKTTVTGTTNKAINPSPANSATYVDVNDDLSWSAVVDANNYNVYFGTSSPGSLIGNQEPNTYDPGTMDANTLYYWRIDANNGSGAGDVWSFTTITAPGKATNPSPANSATDVNLTTDLSWTAGAGADNYDVYFGTSSPGAFQGNQTGLTFDTGTMDNTVYYWCIDPNNEFDTTLGDVWSFATVDAWKSECPVPIFDKDPNFVELYWKAWELAHDHIKVQPGLPQSPYMDEAFSDGHIWIWDTCFMTMFCKYSPQEFPGVETLNNFYVPLHTEDFNDGTYPVQLVWTDNPPLFAWVEHDNFVVTGDVNHVTELLTETEYLQKHFDWFDTVGPGWIFEAADGNSQATVIDKGEYGYKWGGCPSGMDNSPRNQGGLWVDAIGQQGLSALSISRMAEMVDENDIADEWMTEYESIKQDVNNYYWDSNDGIYYDIDPCTLDYLKVKTPASYWPMLAEMCTAAQAAAMAEHITDPNVFGGDRPWPTVAREDPAFVSPDGEYWKGGIWLPTAYMGTKALEKYGYYEEADDAAEKLVSHMLRTYQTYDPHTIWECYSPTRDYPGFYNGEEVREDFCGWSALGPISMFIENVLGFHVIDAHNKNIEWRLHQTQRNGITNLRFGDITTDIVYDGIDHVDVTSDGAYTLTINDTPYSIQIGDNDINDVNF